MCKSPTKGCSILGGRDHLFVMYIYIYLCVCHPFVVSFLWRFAPLGWGHILTQDANPNGHTTRSGNPTARRTFLGWGARRKMRWTWGTYPYISDLNSSDHTSISALFHTFSSLKFNQWEFQDPQVEVLYHIRPCFLGICGTPEWSSWPVTEPRLWRMERRKMQPLEALELGQQWRCDG